MAALVCALASVLVGWPAPPAHAQSSGHASGLSVAIASVTTSGPTGRDALTLTGTVTNRGSAPVYGTVVTLWRSTQRLQALDTLEEALAKPAPEGRTVSDAPGERVTLLAPTSPLAPGASMPFAVTGTRSQLDLGADSSAIVGVDAVASVTPSGPRDAAASARTVATWPSEEQPTSLVKVVALTSTPSRLRANQFLDDHLAAEIAPSGRLAQLLRAAASGQTSWVADPSLIDALSDMADGYQVSGVPAASGAKGAPTPGIGSDDAKTFLAEFAKLPRDRGFATLYGCPDLVGSSSDARVVDRALAASQASSLKLPVVVLAQRIDDASLKLAASRHLTVVTAGIGSAKSWVRASGASVIGALRPDTPRPLDAVGGDSALTRSATLVATARATRTQVRLLISAADLVTDAAATPSWATTTTLPQLMTADAPETALPPTATAPGSLNPSWNTRLDALASGLRAYGSAARASGIAPLAGGLASNAASEAWLGDPAGRETYASAVSRATGASTLKGVHLSAPATVTLSGDTNVFPATIKVERTLLDPITVRVVADSDNSARVAVAASSWVTIAPGDAATVSLTTTASANGVVPVSLRVETADAIAIGEPVDVLVEATNLGQVGWIIIAASGAVLVVTTALRIRQVRARQAASRAGGSGGTA